MAQHPVTLSGIFEDTTSTLTILVRTPPPERPTNIPPERWYPQEGLLLSFDIKVSRRDQTPPRATYIVEGSDPPEMRQIEHVNGSWRFPGTRV